MAYLSLDSPILSGFIVLIYIAAIICSALAILRSRTPQGATAWVMALLFIPPLSVPLFLFFGRSRFEGYNTRRKKHDRLVMNRFESYQTIDDSILANSEEMQLINATISSSNQPGFTSKNKLKLLKDADQTYPAMMQALERAKKYIVFQFYIIRADATGIAFMELLIKKAAEGVRVNFLYDEIGAKIPRQWYLRLQAAGVKIASLHSATGSGRLQINFRNHRKIVIVDGLVAFLGGLNIGDDYRGLWPKWGPWRDTHVMLEGPSVIASQLAAAKDWYCAQETEIDVDWNVIQSEGDSDVFIMHTGPADDQQSCLLAHMALINSARERLWISSPYFVPPESLMDSLLMAALRGVDVRLLVPSYIDSRTVLMASQVYLEKLLSHQIKVFRYTEGFLHQKVLVVDSVFSVISSANLDCRSMFINFEIMAISADTGFNQEVATMLEKDLRRSRPVTLEEFHQQSLLDQIVNRAANLLAPML
jgi:cardiolipin synthase A/B